MVSFPAPSEVVHLHAGGTSLVLALFDDAFPWVVHWGPDLVDVSQAQLSDMVLGLRPNTGDSLIYAQPTVSLLPTISAGWLGRPGVAGSRSGRAWALRIADVRHQVDTAGSAEWEGGPTGTTRVRSVGTDAESGLEVSTELELHPGGLVRLRAEVRNLGPDVYEVAAVEPALPVPADADELLDMAGRHTYERSPQRRPFDVGTWVREARGGRPGHDSSTVLCAGRAGFSFRDGRVWGMHVAYSGNQVLAAERVFNNWRLLRGGELLMPGEVRLEPEESYRSPWLVASWGEGLDQLAQRIHRWVRSRPHHPKRPRPVLLNTWEAVYFQQSLDRLIQLAERAAQVGIERFVLDDGWFRGRRDDQAGLGDWYVDDAVWPDGLGPLAAKVRELGMDFGLWFEPEMVNQDSDLARNHPEWIFDAGHGHGLPSRYQHVLDLGHPDAYAYVLDRISALVKEYEVAYVKWDHNRPLLDAGHSPGGEPGVHRHTEAFYRLLAELRGRHPGLEIESCAGGGGRIDLGVLEYSDRIWASDCIDPHQRQDIQRWTSILLPPELVGTHIGSPVDHSTHRAYGLSFRAGTALWGHLGIEWDLTKASDAELSDLARWVAFHKEVRSLLHSGDVVHGDPPNPALRLEGVVARDRDDALYVLKAMAHPLSSPLGRVTLPGLDPERAYEVRVQPPGDGYPGLACPEWMSGSLRLSGRLLGEVGLQAPGLHPDRLVLVRARAV